MPKKVQVLERVDVFKKFFRLTETRFQHERYDGSMSAVMTRLSLERGESVGVLLHDPVKDQFLLCEQFRIATYANGPGWLIELPAGMVEPGEPPMECARREVEEETGYTLLDIQPVASVYASPGGSTELIHIFYGTFDLDKPAGKGGGVEAEGEDIRLICLTRAEATEMVRNGDIQDAKTLLALQWFSLNVGVSGA